MSKIWKGIKKAFKSVLKIVKVIAIVVVIAAAIYFTAGAAAGAFGALAGGATTGFAASAATFFTTVQTTIATWGAAMWNSAVAAFTGGGAAGTGTGLTATNTFNPALAGIGTTGATSTVAPVAASTLATAETGAVTASLTAGQAAGGGGLLSKAGEAFKDLSVTDKLLLAKTGTDLVGGFTAPTAKEKAEAEKTFVGSFYGRNADGSGGGIVDIGSGGAEQVFTPQRPTPAPTAQGLFDQRTSLATNPEGKVFDPKAAATRPVELFQPQGA